MGREEDMEGGGTVRTEGGRAGGPGKSRGCGASSPPTSGNSPTFSPGDAPSLDSTERALGCPLSSPLYLMTTAIMIPGFYGARTAITVLWALLSGEGLALTQAFCIMVMWVLQLMPLRQRRLNNLPQVT